MIIDESVTFLCSTCQGLLIQPTMPPDTQTLISGSHLNIRQSIIGVSNGAAMGCAICRMLLAVQSTLSYKDHKARTGSLNGFKLRLD